MSSDPLVQHLVQQIDKLDDKVSDLDRRMTSFESRAVTAIWAGTFLAAFFAVGTGVGAHYLVKLRDMESKLKDAQKTLDNIRTDLKPVAAENLAVRISTFKASAPQEPYAWTGYTSDISNLSQFATEYSKLLGGKSDSMVQASLAYDELTGAIDVVQQRAKDRLKNVDKPETYEWHTNQSIGLFRYILNELKQNAAQPGGLSTEQSPCYEKAFPNWLHHIGLPEFPPSGAFTDSAKCKELMVLGAR